MLSLVERDPVGTFDLTVIYEKNPGNKWSGPTNFPWFIVSSNGTMEYYGLGNTFLEALADVSEQSTGIDLVEV